MSSPLPSIQALARAFAKRLEKVIAPHLLEGVRSANKGRYTIEGQDALHEHLDPHLQMHIAWSQTAPVAMDATNHEHTRLVESAMTISKSHDHNSNLIPLAP